FRASPPRRDATRFGCVLSCRVLAREADRFLITDSYTLDQTIEPALVIEAALLTSPHPLPVEQLRQLFTPPMSREDTLSVLAQLAEQWNRRAMRLVEVSSGWRFQTDRSVMKYLARLSEEKPPKYSRAALETLAIIAYRQPATRGDIEDIRGVKVNPDFIRMFQERGWIEVIGRRETAGRPEIFGTTQKFLEDLGLKSLEELPELTQSQPSQEFDLFTPIEKADG
ncbi:MAG TPA: SMC-Scp complex subunit ScpB, partial [Sutterella sp.]|nr:SMC-Scp complex subunit ScpB [Sutterella sp.]